jgi:O-antigen/teichoic acid export membrane protein
METGARGGPRAARMSDGAWTIADQALYAGTNFVLNVALARALTPEAYGAFTTGFVAFLLLGAVHGGILVEPVLVFGAGRFASRRAEYLRWAVRFHVRTAAVIALLLGSAGLVAAAAGLPVLGAALGGFAVAQAGILLHWLLRRACHLVSRPDWAARSCAAYLVLVIVGLVALDAAGSLTALSAALLMGAASLASAVTLATRLDLRRRASTGRLALTATVAHREYGRYAAWSGILEWGQGALPFLVVPALAGLEGAAHLRAVYNLAMPALQVGAALTVMLVPAFVMARRHGQLGAAARRAVTTLVLGAVVYGLVVGLLGDYAIAWLYGGSYAAGPVVRWTLAALPLASVLAGTAVAVLRAQERPGAVFSARVCAVGAGIVLATLLAAWAGVAGALAAAGLTLVIEAVILTVLLRHGAVSRRRSGEALMLPGMVTEPALVP